MNVLVGFVAMTGLMILLLLIAVVPRLAARTTLLRFNPATQSAIVERQLQPCDTRWADFLEQWSRTCSAGSSLHSGFLRTLEQFPDLEDLLSEFSLGLRRGKALAISKVDTFPHTGVGYSTLLVEHTASLHSPEKRNDFDEPRRNDSRFLRN